MRSSSSKRRRRSLASAALHQIPLVRDDDDAAPGAIGFAADRRVLIGRARRRIDDERDDVGVDDGAASRPRRSPVPPCRRARRAPARRMPAVSTMRNRRRCHVSSGVDRVARRARHVADEHALFAQQPVDERRLADVRPADDGDGDSRASAARRPALARRSRSRPASSSASSPEPEPLDDFVEQFGDARAVLGRDLEHRLEAELKELHRRRLRARLSSVLLMARMTGTPGLPQLAGDLLVAGHQPFAAVDDEAR